jgi:Protein of unknown function (DUF1517)
MSAARTIVVPVEVHRQGRNKPAFFSARQSGFFFFSLAQVHEALVRLSSELRSTQKPPSSSLSYLELLDVIWAPMLPTETITRKDLFARYPELRGIES